MPSPIFNIKSYYLHNLLNDIETGIIALPELQRPFVWNNTKVRDLFDSLYKGLPIGYLLLWEVATAEKYKNIGYGVDKKRDPRFLVIDGQQRLTSLYAVIKNQEVYDEKFRTRKVKVSFNPFEAKFEIFNAAIAKDVNWIPDISELFQTTSSHSFINSFINKIRTKKELSQENEDLVSNNISKLYGITAYPFSVLELSPELDVEQVADVFVRINSRGEPLNQSDFILTLMSVYWDEGRKELETFCENAKKMPEDNKPSSFNHITTPIPAQILRTIVGYAFLRGRLKYAYLTLQGKDLEERHSGLKDELRELNFKKLKEAQALTLDLTNWHNFIKIIKSAGFVNPWLISSKTAYFVTYAIYLLGKKYNLDYRTLEKIVRKWFVFSILTQRYTGSPESQIEQDLSLFKKGDTALAETLEKIINTQITPDYWDITLPQTLNSSSTTNNVYLVYLASLIFSDTRVFLSDIKVKDVLSAEGVNYKKSPVDIHHLFPKNYLRKIGLTSVKDTNQVANYVYLEYKDNIKISDKKPSEYWKEMSTNGYLGDSEINKILQMQGIPENFYELEYSDFLKQRRSLMTKMVQSYFNKL